MVFSAMYQPSHDTEPEWKCCTGSLAVAQNTVHLYYRQLVPEGEDAQFKFMVITNRGFQGIPEGNLNECEEVVEFQSLENGPRAWVRSFDGKVYRDLHLMKPLEGVQ